MYKEGDLVYHKTWFDANTQANVIASDFHISNANARNWDTQAQWQCFSKISDDDKALAEEFAAIS